MFLILQRKLLIKAVKTKKKENFQPNIVCRWSLVCQTKRNNNLSQVMSQNVTLNSETVKSNWSETLYHSCVIYCSLLCMAVFFVLGGLIAWHARLISRGETSIESHINKKERARLAKENQVYKNPYDFGPVKNWKIFLCVGDKRPWWHLLFPFADKPEGDGLQWQFLSQYEDDDKDSEQEVSRTISVKIS